MASVLNRGLLTLQGTADSAAALAHLVGDEDVVAGLFEFLSLLGIQGMGLVEATERAPTVGHVIGLTLVSSRHISSSPGACNHSNRRLACQ